MLVNFFRLKKKWDGVKCLAIVIKVCAFLSRDYVPHVLMNLNCFPLRFDSIESMNSEELLVKRRRGSKKYLIVLAVFSTIFFIVGVLIGYFSHPGGDDSGTSLPPSADGKR